MPLWAGWSISTELSGQGGGRLCHPPRAGSHGRSSRPVCPIVCSSWCLPFLLPLAQCRDSGASWEGQCHPLPTHPERSQHVPCSCMQGASPGPLLVPRGGPVVESHWAHLLHPSISGAPAQPLPSHGALALVLNNVCPGTSHVWFLEFFLRCHDLLSSRTCAKGAGELCLFPGEERGSPWGLGISFCLFGPQCPWQGD